MDKINFTYTQDFLKNYCDEIINKAIQYGASSCKVEINEIISQDIAILNQSIENFETSYGCSMSIVVFVGNKKGVSAITSLAKSNVDSTILHAIDIAKYTEDDDANGLPEKKFLANNNIINKIDLELYHINTKNNYEIIDNIKELEELSINGNNKVFVSDGASFHSSYYNFRLASSNGFNSGYFTSRYNKGISLIAKTSHGMQTDYCYSNKRNYNKLDNNIQLANQIHNKLTRRLNKSTIKTGTYNVIFESDIAKSIINNFFAAINGNNIFRNLSFLNNSIHKQIFPQWLTIIENPFEKEGLGSCFFDNEGVIVSKKEIVTNGILNTYLLNSYTAKKLQLNVTGNSGGTHNINISHNFDGNINNLAKELFNGLIIIETIGHGVNIVTGDYSVGASGLLVKNGIIGEFVENFTLSGNLKNIFNNIKYIANDYIHSSLNCGSMLVENIKIASNE
jgi:PmbA protein